MAFPPALSPRHFTAVFAIPLLASGLLAALVACGASAASPPSEPSPPLDDGNDASASDVADGAAGPDGGPSDPASLKDGSTAGPTGCDHTKPFSAVTVIMTGSAGIDLDDAFVSADERTLLYSQFVELSEQAALYTATRSGTSGPFAATHQEVALDNGYKPDKAVWISDDGLTSYASTITLNVRTNQIYRFTRSAALASWSPSTLVAGLDPGGSTLSPLDTPFVLGNQIYYSSDAPSGARLYAADMTTPAPAELEGLPTNGSSANPVLTPDGLTLYWAFHELGGDGETRIWRAQRTSTGAAFDSPAVVAATTLPVPGSVADSYWPVGVSADDCRLYAMHSPTGQGVVNDVRVFAR